MRTDRVGDHVFCAIAREAPHVERSKAITKAVRFIGVEFSSRKARSAGLTRIRNKLIVHNHCIKAKLAKTPRESCGRPGVKQGAKAMSKGKQLIFFTVTSAVLGVATLAWAQTPVQ